MKEILKKWSEIIKVSINEWKYYERSDSYVIYTDTDEISMRDIKRLNNYINEKGWIYRVNDIWADKNGRICLWLE